MFAISFDINTAELEKAYGTPYNSAYDSVASELKTFGFFWAQNGLYVLHDENNELLRAWDAIDRLSEIEWFARSVRDIQVFEIRLWTDVTERVRGNLSKADET